MTQTQEKLNWRMIATITKYRAGEKEPYAIEVYPGNLLLNEGIALLWDLALGSAGTAFNNANSRIGVGNGSAVATATQTALQGGSSTFAPMAAGYPQRTNQSVDWQGTFGTGSANFAWEEWCADEKTEILTRVGWKHYDELILGEDVLTLDLSSLTAHWEAVQGIYIGPPKTRKMLHLKTTIHDSLTTLSHRWPVKQRHKREHGKDYYSREWRLSSELDDGSCILLAAPLKEPPMKSSYSESLVKLAAWYWTEGWRTYRDRPGMKGGIGQSLTRHPQHVAAIRTALQAEFGKVGWSERQHDMNNIIFNLNHAAMRSLDTITEGKSKAPTYQFLTALTSSQLKTFIETCLDGDGHETPSGQKTWYQVSETAIGKMEYACALAGQPTRLRHQRNYGNRFGRTPMLLSLLRRNQVRPVQSARLGHLARREVIDHFGIVWCPTTPSHTWLARRNGTVYFTGNSVDNGSTGTTNLNRKATAMGTKDSTQIWVITASCTMS